LRIEFQFEQRYLIRTLSEQGLLDVIKPLINTSAATDKEVVGFSSLILNSAQAA